MSHQVQGWCPSTLRPMPSGDGLLVRIRPPMAELSPAQTKGLADAALRFGNGLIDLSARGNIQLRGVRDHAGLLGALEHLDLIPPEPNRTVTPYWSANDGTKEINDALQPLPFPDKFGFAIDTGPVPVLRDTSADIRIERHGAGFLVHPDTSLTGALAAKPAEAADLANGLATWFLTQNAPRMAKANLAHLPSAFHSTPVLKADHRPTPGPRLVALEWGQMTAATLAALAANPIRITPWRMILLLEPIPHPALITDPTDPRLTVTACIGAPGCLQAMQPTRSLGLTPPKGQHLHISGCSKGCAHPAPGLTLTATATGFTLIRHGRASDPGISFEGTF